MPVLTIDLHDGHKVYCVTVAKYVLFTTTTAVPFYGHYTGQPALATSG